MIKILFVCLGNICRSPMADGIMRQKVKEAGLDDK
ncbi:MAG: low molecular weight phosphotyrosine protein phosphatase, partial [Chloroflexota bacterium]